MDWNREDRSQRQLADGEVVILKSTCHSRFTVWRLERKLNAINWTKRQNIPQFPLLRPLGRKGGESISRDQHLPFTVLSLRLGSIGSLDQAPWWIIWEVSFFSARAIGWTRNPIGKIAQDFQHLLYHSFEQGQVPLIPEYLHHPSWNH